MKIFISYRRSDSDTQARLLKKCVEKYLSPRDVFMDVHSIPDGVEFADFIAVRIARCDAMFVLIGPQWLDAQDANGRRLDQPGDFVRNEIAAGLKRGGLKVIPLILDGATVPPASALPSDIAGLPSRNAHKVRSESFESDVEILLKDMGLKTHSSRRRLLFAGAGGVGLLAASAAGSFILRWPPQFYPSGSLALPEYVRIVTDEARAASDEAAADGGVIEQARTAILEAQRAKARAESAGDSAEYEYGDVTGSTGRYQGKRRDPAVPVHGVFQGAAGESYEGQWLGLKYEGAGQFNTGANEGVVSCVGLFVANVITGLGELNYADGSIYRGDIVGRAPRGRGVLTKASGTTLVGQFLDGELDGPGAEFDKDDNAIKVGTWRKGVLVRAHTAAQRTSAEEHAAAPAPELREDIARLADRAREAEQQALVLAERGRQFSALAQQFGVDARRLIPAPGNVGARATVAAIGGELLEYYQYGDGGEYVGQHPDVQGALGVYTSGAPTHRGDVYSGAFHGENTLEHFGGFGVYQFAPTTMDTPDDPKASQFGEFAESKQTAFGQMDYRDGRTYFGAIALDFPTGPGVTRFANGAQHVGEHAGGRMNGLGVEYAADGTFRQGRWTNGQLTEPV